MKIEHELVMPKRQKKVKKELENEGRPPEATLADFIRVKIGPSKEATFETEKPIEATANDELSAAAASVSGNSTLNIISQDSDPVNRDTSFYICKTKKGKYPIQIESRSGNKKLTIVENVFGDPKDLLQDLKTMLGTGGRIRDGRIEIQGSFLFEISRYFDSHQTFIRPYSFMQS